MNWLAHHKTSPNVRLRLFAFPFGGGAASVFRSWSTEFSSEIEICPVQLPGRETRVSEKPITRMSQMVQELVPAINSYADLPFAFFGHSMGALIAYEIACNPELRRNNLIHIFVSSCRAPQDMPRGLRRHGLSDDQLIAEMRRLGAPDEVLCNSELLRYLLPVMRADFQLVDTYQYQPSPRLTCPVSAFVGETDSEVSERDLCAWRQHTTSDFSTKTFAGNHFYIANDPRPVIRAICLYLTPVIGPTAVVGKPSSAGNVGT